MRGASFKGVARVVEDDHVVGGDGSQVEEVRGKKGLMVY